ncbi:MAG TPA: thiamine diphosphokinase [Firmicutes bacterium]|nr:thiamine diphosphokinase [Candidatus Fermentithermobacillaceae bacterium]
MDVSRNSQYAAIVGGGDVSPHIADYVRGASLVVAADSGAEFLLDQGIKVDVLVGDFDSCDPGALENVTKTGCRVMRLPVRKDVTDTEAALEFVLSEGYRAAVMAGSMGGKRVDHEFANFFLVERFARRGLDVVLVSPRSIICHVSGPGYMGMEERTLRGKKGDWVSLFPITEKVSGVTLHGFDYPLTDAVLERGATLGVSNKLIASEGRVRVSDGFLMIVMTKE